MEKIFVGTFVPGEIYRIRLPEYQFGIESRMTDD